LQPKFAIIIFELLGQIIIIQQEIAIV